jgi:SRSO17 transposase
MDWMAPGRHKGKRKESIKDAVRSLRAAPKRLTRCAKRFDSKFMTRARPSIKTARQYLRGMLQSDRRNMERMEQVVPAADEQFLQRFIFNSPWDTEGVMKQVGGARSGGSSDDPRTR